MKKLFIVANWKSNKTSDEAIAWLQEINSNKQELKETEKEIIVCASFTLLPAMKAFIIENNLPIKLGAQEVSPFSSGAYTGAVNAKQVREFAEYVIIGHSERRKNFGETDEILAREAQKALSDGLTPIFCVQGENTSIPDGVSFVAFEPVEAIGSGHPDTPEDAEKVAKEVKRKHPAVQYVLYGGSVTSDNVAAFTKQPSLNGALVGGASPDEESFSHIILKA